MIEALSTPPVDSTALRALALRSTALIERLQDASGAYPASPTFSAYRGYSWFRDGAFIADAMSSAGKVQSASSFFDWCSRIVVDRREKIAAIVARASSGDPAPDRDMLPTRFTFDGSDGADDWWDFQLDGYGTWLWAVVEHAERHGLDLAQWREAIGLTIDYLVSSWRRPCFDWWEESADQVHVSTLGCIAAGLQAAARADSTDALRVEACGSAVADILALIELQGTHDDHLAKWLGSPEVDASLLAVVSPLAIYPVDGALGRSSVEAVRADLEVGLGVHRYRTDTFFGGGQWPLLSCFLGLADAAAGHTDTALDLLRWAASTANAEGELPEQVGQHLLDPTRVDEWVERWGPVAQPLLWSHAMYVRLAVELGVVELAQEASA